MANYNTFNIIECNTKRTILITTSARKAKKLLVTGFRVEVWNNNELVNKIYAKERSLLTEYVNIEKEYIRQKQAKAEARNRRRKEKARYKH